MRRDGRGRGRRTEEDEVVEYKSKNLEAERKRRDRINQRLMDLRSLVPIITNMTKAAIIEDAMTYIEGLQQQVKGLTESLHEMELHPPEPEEFENENENENGEEMEKHSVQAEVKVTHLEGNRFWIKIVCDEKRGCFTKIMEVMNSLGFEIIDTNFTFIKGVTLTTLCVKGNHVELSQMEQLEEFLLKVIVEGVN